MIEVLLISKSGILVFSAGFPVGSLRASACFLGCSEPPQDDKDKDKGSTSVRISFFILSILRGDG